MTTKAPLRVFFIVDGYTLKKANDYYRLYHPCHTPLDFRAIKNWARKEALRLFTPVSRYAQMQCHYYHPYKDPQMYCHSHGISCLERELRYTGFQIHYCEQVGPDGVKPNMSHSFLSTSARFFSISSSAPFVGLSWLYRFSLSA